MKVATFVLLLSSYFEPLQSASRALRITLGVTLEVVLRLQSAKCSVYRHIFIGRGALEASRCTL